MRIRIVAAIAIAVVIATVSRPAAEAGVPYRLWMRAIAEANYWGNHSVFVQFGGSVTANAGDANRIGTTAATSYVLKDCLGCGVSGWGWQDNSYGSGVLGPLVSFAQSGSPTIRAQGREDGISIGSRW